MDIKSFQKEVHDNAIDHGWWEAPRGFAEIIALCHSELSEALEAYREVEKYPWEIYQKKRDHVLNREYFVCPEDKELWNPASKPEGMLTELADCVIRIMDYCGYKGWDLEKAIQLKHEYNKSRPYRHGGKKI